MTEDQTLGTQKIRAQGFALIIWTPDELGSANPRKVQERLVEMGWDVISDLQADNGASNSAPLETSDNPTLLTPEQTAVIRQLRSEGCAVVSWTPEEVGTANPRKIEDRQIEMSWDVIKDLQADTPREAPSN